MTSQAGNVEGMDDLTGLTHETYGRRQMPYRREGSVVYVKKNDRWEVLKRHSSAEKAQKHLTALNINVEAPKHGHRIPKPKER